MIDCTFAERTAVTSREGVSRRNGKTNIHFGEE